MKLSTKLAIVGMVVVMLGGAGIWMTMHRGEEKPIPKVNEMKVERRANVEAPAMVVGRPEKKKEDDFTFEEFNRLLDILFQEEKSVGEKTEMESDEGMINIASSDDGRSQRDDGRGEENTSHQEEIEQAYENLMKVVDEYRVMRDEYWANIDERNELASLMGKYSNPETIEEAAIREELEARWKELVRRYEQLWYELNEEERKLHLAFERYHYLLHGDSGWDESLIEWFNSLGTIQLQITEDGLLTRISGRYRGIFRK